MKYKVTFHIEHTLKGYVADDKRGSTHSIASFQRNFETDIASWKEGTAMALAIIKERTEDLESKNDIHKISIEIESK